MLLFVLAHLGCPRQNPASRKTVVCVYVCVCVCVFACVCLRVCVSAIFSFVDHAHKLFYFSQHVNVMYFEQINLTVVY